MNLVVDIGNTTAKIAVFDKYELIAFVQDANTSLIHLAELCQKYPIERGIVSSVVRLTDDVRVQLNDVGVQFLYFTSETPVPVEVLYQTPQTLGTDRIAAVVAAHEQQPDRELLVVDSGTCVTYEFIDAEGIYRGGNISPGLQMRLNALHAFTDKLPQISLEGDIPPFGYTTETAIRAGVYRGLQLEIEGYITRLREKYPRLLVFLTGGDCFSFDTPIKSIIFADKFLVLKGLNRILTYNETL